MRRFNPDVWSGVAMFAVMLLAAGPMLFGAIPTRVPHVVWIGLFVVMLLALLGAVWGADDPRRGSRAVVLLGIAAAASWGLVLSAGGRGLVAILLVITVALCPYIVSLRAGCVLIVLNEAVLLISLSLGLRVGEPGWWVELAILGGFYLLIQAASMFSSAALLREQQARRRLAEAHVELRAATALLAESTRTNERLRISRDLHDLIGHQLTVLTLELEAAKHRAGAEAEAGSASGNATLSSAATAAVAHIERAGGVARELLASVRATVGELRGGGADLRATLRSVVEAIEEPRVVLEVDDTIELDEERTVLVVRAVQEIVTNTIRHARAEALRIELRATPTGLLLRAVDDGWGAREVVLGNGLRGLRERFEEFGGTVEYEGSGTARNAEPVQVAGGFRLTARLPLAARALGGAAGGTEVSAGREVVTGTVAAGAGGADPESGADARGAER